MSQHHSNHIRLYTDAKIEKEKRIILSDTMYHHLIHVLRKKIGETVHLFNGEDGQWLGIIDAIEKKTCQVRIIEKEKNHEVTSDIWLCFAPVKYTSLHILLKKSTELGATVLQPVVTERTIVRNPNKKRMFASLVQASEQTGRISLPHLNEPVSLQKLLTDWSPHRKILFCDETHQGKPLAQILLKAGKSSSYAILIGPEGGFSKMEVDFLYKQPYVIGVDMGPRVLKVDTAAIAALACYQSILGDWCSS